MAQRAEKRANAAVARPVITPSLAHLAHEQGRDVHVGGVRVRADCVLGHLEGFGYGVGAAEAHALGGLGVAAHDDDAAQVVEGMGSPVQYRERVGAVVGVGAAVEGAVPGVVSVLLLVLLVDLAYVVGLGERLVLHVYVARVVDFVVVRRHGVGYDEEAAYA